MLKKVYIAQINFLFSLAFHYLSFLSYLQDEVNQIVTSNVRLKQVRVSVPVCCYLSRYQRVCCGEIDLYVQKLRFRQCLQHMDLVL